MKTFQAGIFLALLFATLPLIAESPAQQLDQANTLFKQGNSKEAYNIFMKLAHDPSSPSEVVVKAVPEGVTCLRRLNRVKEIDNFLEDTIKKHPEDWEALSVTARIYLGVEHFGFMIAGNFERGAHRGGGKSVNSYQRDRVRALQLFDKSLQLAEKQAKPVEVYDLCMNFANAILYNRGYAEAWRLQYLTDLSKLPDYEEGYGYYYFGRSGVKGAPVTQDGTPVYYSLIAKFADAANDGERWRWLLNKAAEVMPDRKNSVDAQFASFLLQQFGVQTMVYGNPYFKSSSTFEKDESGPYAVNTLKETETIAKLATGIKRFSLPDEFNFIKIYHKIADDGEHVQAEGALRSLADIYTNRRQYDKAAEMWQSSIKRFGPGIHNRKQNSLDQIIKNWGRFSNNSICPAGQEATLAFRFRNAEKVHFEAFHVKTKELLDDVKKYLESNPAKLDWQKVNITNIGNRLVRENQTQYIGEKLADWDLNLEPLKGHFDKEITVKTPCKEPGAYLIVATLPEGNVSRIIVWITDTVILRKQLDGKVLFYVADALTGQPVANADLNIFGYEQKYVGKKLTNAFLRKYDIKTINKNVETGKDGISILTGEDMNRDYNWLVTATSKEGRFAFLGFQRIWFNNQYDPEYNATRTFLITDRPVYRPDQKVKFKFWIRKSQYDMADIANFANRAFTVVLRNAKGDKLMEKSITADAFGGIAGEYQLKSDAALGNYYIFIQNYGGGNFRVEEYKKPEYEVSIEAPSEPVKLGDKITALIKAKYYFGAPVTEAKVKYKVMRTNHDSVWHPWGVWDWLYGTGYWWFAPNYEWYPGWRKWGCFAPVPWWWHRNPAPPELIMENEVEIGKDGTVKVEIDSSVAKALFGDTDHKYEITAEVVDLSRRTIVGKGSVIAAREPFKVTCWVDRGYFRIGDTITASFAARTVDGKPVKGKGNLRLLKISYDKEMKPVEKEVQNWPLDTGVDGRSQQKLKASESGQYRLAYTVTDAKGNAIEGGYVFSIRGAKPDWTAAGKDFRFNDIEVLNDKKEYVPGEKANLMINTELEDSCVLLFLRPTNGVYLPPKVMRLNGKSAFEAVEIGKKDMPNFFVEALTVSGGKIHTAVKEIIVPPEKRILNVEIEPSREKYKPGQKAKVKLKITDIFGKPIQSSAVITVYDKSVEYISGGSNVQEIKAFFWKWRRSFYSNTYSNTTNVFYNLMTKNEVPMRYLGVFGDMLQPAPGTDADGEGNTFAMDGLGAAGGERKRGVSMFKSMAAPMAAKAEMAEEKMADDKAGAEPESPAEAGNGGGGQEAAVTVRKNFADTAYWNATVSPDKDGMAEIELDMPENLTTWKIKVWGMANGTKVGQGETEVITSKDLIIRLQAPRFFVEKDEVTLSAIVHNYLESAKEVKVALKLIGDNLEIIEPGSVFQRKMQKGTLPPSREQIQTQTITVDSKGEARINWRVKVLKEGETTIQMSAITDEESDAMEMKFPVLVHGIMKQVPQTGSIATDDAKGIAKFAIDVPEQRRIEESVLELRYSPTLAGAMVDALPYMVSYPYGCTEQTLNRFVPTVITRKILKDMGLDLKQIKEKRTNLNAQEIGNDKERAAQWKKRAIIIGYNSDGSPKYTDNPVFDEEIVDDMIAEGVKRLRSMQNSDGGWGWFSGWGEYSYPHTTGVVVHGLQIAKANGADIPDVMISSGVSWLQNYQKQELVELDNYPKKVHPGKQYADNQDAFVFMILVDAKIKTNDMTRMLAYLYRDRNHLSVYAKAMFGIALHRWADLLPAEKAETIKQRDMLIRNIEQYLVMDKENQTAYLNLQNNHYWWYWYGSEYEALSYYLKLLCVTEPKSQKASWLVKYLINNRKHATYWESTRDTAICIEALADYIRASGEDVPDMTVEITYDDKVVKKVKINKENLFSYDNKLVLKGKEITSGKHKIVINRTGKGPVYFNSYLSYFSLEDFITKAGLEIKVHRKYYKLEKVDKTVKVQGAHGQALDQKVEKFERKPIANLATLKSGDLVEIELIIESKNDYEYIIFADMKPAGFETCEVRSGYNGNEMGAYVEFRDEKVCFFIRQLARGKHSVSYRMIAEIPGKFSALPTQGSAMYAPELKANSDEIKLNVVDKE